MASRQNLERPSIDGPGLGDIIRQTVKMTTPPMKSFRQYGVLSGRSPRSMSPSLSPATSSIFNENVINALGERDRHHSTDSDHIKRGINISTSPMKSYRQYGALGTRSPGSMSPLTSRATLSVFNERLRKLRNERDMQHPSADINGDKNKNNINIIDKAVEKINDSKRIRYRKPDKTPNLKDNIGIENSDGRNVNRCLQDGTLGVTGTSKSNKNINNQDVRHQSAEYSDNSDKTDMNPLRKHVATIHNVQKNVNDQDQTLINFNDKIDDTSTTENGTLRLKDKHAHSAVSSASGIYGEGMPENKTIVATKTGMHADEDVGQNNSLQNSEHAIEEKHITEDYDSNGPSLIPELENSFGQEEENEMHRNKDGMKKTEQGCHEAEDKFRATAKDLDQGNIDGNDVGKLTEAGDKVVLSDLEKAAETPSIKPKQIQENKCSSMTEHSGTVILAGGDGEKTAERQNTVDSNSLENAITNRKPEDTQEVDSSYKSEDVGQSIFANNDSEATERQNNVVSNALENVVTSVKPEHVHGGKSSTKMEDIDQDMVVANVFQKTSKGGDNAMSNSSKNTVVRQQVNKQPNGTFDDNRYVPFGVPRTGIEIDIETCPLDIEGSDQILNETETETRNSNVPRDAHATSHVATDGSNAEKEDKVSDSEMQLVSRVIGVNGRAIKKPETERNIGGDLYTKSTAFASEKDEDETKLGAKDSDNHAKAQLHEGRATETAKLYKIPQLPSVKTKSSGERNNGVPVGPGRPARCGPTVSPVVTRDPKRSNTTTFIAPNAASPPSDTEYDCERVILDFVTTKYGNERETVEVKTEFIRGRRV